MSVLADTAAHQRRIVVKLALVQQYRSNHVLLTTSHAHCAHDSCPLIITITLPMPRVPQLTHEPSLGYRMLKRNIASPYFVHRRIYTLLIYCFECRWNRPIYRDFPTIDCCYHLDIASSIWRRTSLCWILHKGGTEDYRPIQKIRHAENRRTDL